MLLCVMCAYAQEGPQAPSILPLHASDKALFAMAHAGEIYAEIVILFLPLI